MICCYHTAFVEMWQGLEEYLFRIGVNGDAFIINVNLCMVRLCGMLFVEKGGNNHYILRIFKQDKQNVTGGTLYGQLC